MLADPWKRGTCKRPDCQECRDADRGCIWNPYRCEVTREENRSKQVAEVLKNVRADHVSMHGFGNLPAYIKPD